MPFPLRLPKQGNCVSRILKQAFRLRRRKAGIGFCLRKKIFGSFRWQKPPSAPLLSVSELSYGEKQRPQPRLKRFLFPMLCSRLQMPALPVRKPYKFSLPHKAPSLHLCLNPKITPFLFFPAHRGGACGGWNPRRNREIA